MGIEVQGHLDALVPETLLHDIRWHAGRQEQAGTGMSEPVQGNALDCGYSLEFGKFPIPKARDAQRIAERIVLPADR